LDHSAKGEVLTVTLASYQEKLSNLVVNVAHGRASPHKICMVLALLDMARAGALVENRIRYDAPLLERYARFFDAVRGPRDHPNPYFPFFHLKGKLRGGDPSFWQLIPLPGRETALAAMHAARCPADIVDNVEYAIVDDELFDLLRSPTAVDALGGALALRWFDRGLDELRSMVVRCNEISAYELDIRTGTAVHANEPTPPAYIRDPAFRRVVIQVYDFRCAATGVRFMSPSGEAMVEAAHIHPFSEAGDDDPRNGLALTPDMHWAMDRNLIAPGPDMRWHVSPLLDARVPEHRLFFALDNQKLIGPAEHRMTPKRECLEWRMARLREPDWIDRDRAD